MKTSTIKHKLYTRAFIKTAEVVTTPEPELAVIKKLIFYGVKFVNTKPDSPTSTKDEALRYFQIADGIQRLMGLLTPSEFVNLFPITKDFDGHKYGVKDYFYTRDYIKTLPDAPIGDIDKVMEFLWKYQNWEVVDFFINYLGFVDDLRRLEGHPSLAEEFCAEHGIKSFTMHTDKKGKKFMVDRDTGKSFRVRRKIPRYLRLVK